MVLEKRLERSMGSTLNKEMISIEKNTTFLATTGSAAFIGLFGTVWGIMNSFQSIATAKNTSLTIVAPDSRSFIGNCTRTFSSNSCCNIL